VCICVYVCERDREEREHLKSVCQDKKNNITDIQYMKIKMMILIGDDDDDDDYNDDTDVMIL